MHNFIMVCLNTYNVSRNNNISMRATNYCVIIDDNNP